MTIPCLTYLDNTLCLTPGLGPQVDDRKPTGIWWQARYSWGAGYASALVVGNMVHRLDEGGAIVPSDSYSELSWH